MPEATVQVAQQSSPPEQDTEKKEDIISSIINMRSYLLEGFYDNGLTELDYYFDESVDFFQEEMAAKARNGNWPMQERCVHGEINDTTVPLHRNEVFCRFPVQHYEKPPFRNFYYREWSEVEHLFMPAIKFAEQMYGDCSPCASPTPTTKGV